MGRYTDIMQNADNGYIGRCWYPSLLLEYHTMPADLTVRWHSTALLCAECNNNNKKYSFLTCDDNNDWIWVGHFCCTSLEEIICFSKNPNVRAREHLQCRPAIEAKPLARCTLQDPWAACLGLCTQPTLVKHIHHITCWKQPCLHAIASWVRIQLISQCSQVCDILHEDWFTAWLMRLAC